MRLHIADHPLITHKLSVLRDKNTPSPVFRELVSELMTLLAYEATRDIRVDKIKVQTPVAETDGVKLAHPRPIIVPILRAGLGMLDGMLRLVPTAEVGFVGMIRDEVTLEPSNRPWLPVLDATPLPPASPAFSAGPGPIRTPEMQWLLLRPVTDLLRYQATSHAHWRQGPLARVEALPLEYRELPPGFNPRTLQLATDMMRASTAPPEDKGALVAMCFDLTLRAEGKTTLDAVMRALWERCKGGPMTEADFAAVLKELGGRSFTREIAAWVHGTRELPLQDLNGDHKISLAELLYFNGC